MKKISLTNIILLVLLILSVAYASFNKIEKPRPVKLGSFADSLSYAVGLLSALSVADIPYDFNTNMVLRGFVNAKDSDIMLLSEDDIDSLFERFYEVLETTHIQEHESLFNENVMLGNIYMAQNAMNPEITVTESGLQYKVLVAGNGRTPNLNSVVKAHYTGRFITGEVFDSSHIRSEPIEFLVDDVIEGWQEALLLMKEGSLFEIVVPYTLAYGTMGYDVIEPGMTLLFEIELIEIIR